MKGGSFVLLAIAGAVLWGAGLALDLESGMLAFLAALGTVLFALLGALFFVLLHHVVDAGWSVVPRRWAELLLIRGLPAAAAATVVVVAGAGGIYHWMHPAPDDVLYAGKAPWLNLPFFAVRLAIYFAVWIGLARMYVGGSLRQDETGDPAITLRLRRWAGAALVAYGFTAGFAAIDLLMTPDHHWYSTIFGVYVWGQGVVAGFALLCLFAFRFRAGGLADKVPDAVLRTLGLWLFAFAAFWGYLAASQWILIWYGNIPEETVWLIERWHHGWQFLGAAAVAGLFAIPFVVLMPAESKRRPVLKLVAGLALLGHWFGMLWITMPVASHGSLAAGLLAAPGALALLVGATGHLVRGSFAKHSVYPTNDPRLAEALPGAEGGH